MATKMGNGGHGSEAYDPRTGKFIADGKPNKYYENAEEDKKIAGGMSSAQIRGESARSMSDPTPNLGEYAEPKSKTSVLREEFDIDSSESFEIPDGIDSEMIKDYAEWIGVELSEDEIAEIEDGYVPTSIAEDEKELTKGLKEYLTTF